MKVQNSEAGPHFLLHGESRCGKSSFLAAGILARLPNSWQSIYLQLNQGHSGEELFSKVQKRLNVWTKECPVLCVVEKLASLPPEERERILEILEDLVKEFPHLQIVFSLDSQDLQSLESFLEKRKWSFETQGLKSLESTAFKTIWEAFSGDLIQEQYPLALSIEAQEQLFQKSKEWSLERFQLYLRLLWQAQQAAGGKRAIVQQELLWEKSSPNAFFVHQLQGLRKDMNSKDWQGIFDLFPLLDTYPPLSQLKQESSEALIRALIQRAILWKQDTFFQENIYPGSSQLGKWLIQHKGLLEAPLNPPKVMTTPPNPPNKKYGTDYWFGLVSTLIIIVLLGVFLFWLFASRNSTTQVPSSQDLSDSIFKTIADSAFRDKQTPDKADALSWDDLEEKPVIQLTSYGQATSIQGSAPSWWNFLLPRKYQQKRISFNLENPSDFPVKIMEGKLFLQGENSLHNLSLDSFWVVKGQREIPAQRTMHYELALKNSSLLKEDSYKGKLLIYFPYPVKEVEVPLTISSRMATSWALLILLAGIIFARLFKYVSQNRGVDKQISRLLDLEFGLGKVADQNLRDQLRHELDGLRVQISRPLSQERLDQVIALINALETKIDWTHTLEGLSDRVNMSEAAQSWKDEVYALIEQLSQLVLSGKFDEAKTLFDDILTKFEAYDSNTARSLDNSIKEAITIAKQFKTRVRSRISAYWQKSSPSLTNFGKRVRGIPKWLFSSQFITDVRFHILRPMVGYGVLVIVLLFGFDEIYLQGDQAFGTDRVLDFIKLFLWGSISDIFSRSLLDFSSFQENAKNRYYPN